MSNALKSFRDLMIDVKTLTGWGAKGTIAAPFADYIVPLGPPWPEHLPVWTSMFELLVLIVLFTFTANKSKKALRRMIVVALVICLMSVSIYLAASSQIVYSAPDESRLIAGFTVRDDVLPLLNESFRLKDALHAAGYDPNLVWTQSSITLSRMLMVSLWMVAFGSFVTVLGVFARKQALE